MSDELVPAEFNIDSWWQDAEPTAVTLEQMNQLCERIVELRTQKEDLETQIGGLNSLLKRAESQFIQFLKEAGMKNLKNEHGQFSITKRTTVNQPVDRDAFIAYLKSKGDYENMVSFNSKKLQSYVMGEIEEKVREGNPDWLPPGISKPGEFETISVRKK